MAKAMKDVLKELVTGDEMWAYYQDPLTKRQSMQWVKKKDSRPTKVRRSRSAKKTMYIIFFNSAGVVSTSRLFPTKKHSTMTSEFYVETSPQETGTDAQAQAREDGTSWVKNTSR
ncbi:hypothetical protein BV898_07005 [Hypsibius exemplaris]|uniref:Uncharacterized protein n=1 Tax=Hypsibius exemplaris TaxID=2072580 RepID=A0A1W0WUR8_HYPEX|nr:hypothetical protein BV898_07005 [Hypsibius exemplaris]